MFLLVVVPVIVVAAVAVSSEGEGVIVVIVMVVAVVGGGGNGMVAAIAMWINTRGKAGSDRGGGGGWSKFPIGAPGREHFYGRTGKRCPRQQEKKVYTSLKRVVYSP